MKKHVSCIVTVTPILFDGQKTTLCCMVYRKNKVESCACRNSGIKADACSWSNCRGNTSSLHQIDDRSLRITRRTVVSIMKAMAESVGSEEHRGSAVYATADP